MTDAEIGMARIAELRARAGQRVAVLIPCFNEEANVSPLVSRLLAVFERRKIAGEIVLVNDCSTDATGRVIEGLASRHPEVVGIHHPANRGLSASWDTGLEAANGTRQPSKDRVASSVLGATSVDHDRAAAGARQKVMTVARQR